jgi:hypothetical protein
MSEETPPVPLPPSLSRPLKVNVVSVISFASGIASLASGLLSIVSVITLVFMAMSPFFVGLGVLTALTGFITGIVGLGEVKKKGEKGKGMAITGLILSILFFVCACIMSILLALAAIGALDK